jgi:hypothetical protein
MMNHLALLRTQELWMLFAGHDGGDSLPLLQRLPPHQRVRVMAALVVVIALGGLLLLGVRAGGRIARWYINRPVGGNPLVGNWPTVRSGALAAPAPEPAREREVRQAPPSN